MKRILTLFTRYGSLVIRPRAFVLVSMLVLILICSLSASADSFSKYRIDLGVKLFRTLVKADLALETKRSPDGFITIHLLYEQDDTTASYLADSLRTDVKHIKNIPVKVDILPSAQYLKKDHQPGLAVFIVEKINAERLSLIINKSTEYQHILFSPFEGDVEAGVFSGLSVESKVRPYINLTALKKNKLQIKSFYLKVAKKHEE